MPANTETALTIRATLSGIPPQKIAVRDMTANDFYEALKLVSKTVSEEDKLKYENFVKSFGNF